TIRATCGVCAIGKSVVKVWCKARARFFNGPLSRCPALGVCMRVCVCVTSEH
ncbi:AGAP011209-PA, partial [Anopheles gambiae str. PEST]